LNVINRGWIELRELPNNEPSETSYFRFQDIEHISFIEDNDGYFPIFVTVLGSQYLYNRVETLGEAQQASEQLIQDIESTKVKA
jgi:hypothetical protein